MTIEIVESPVILEDSLPTASLECEESLSVVTQIDESNVEINEQTNVVAVEDKHVEIVVVEEVTVVTPYDGGIAGPQGPPGQGGGGGSSGPAYIHTQSSNSQAWVVYHQLNRYPLIYLTDLNNNPLNGQISYPNSDSALVQFNDLHTGLAYCY